MTNPYPGNSHWPGDYQGCTLTATYVGLNGAPVAGSITLTARPDVIQDFAGFKIIVPVGLSVTLDSNGSFTMVVPATDDPDVSPQYWTYLVVENFPGGRTYDIEASMNTTVDLVTAAPVAKFDGIPITRGPQGLGVVGLAIDGSGHLIATMSDGSTLDAGDIDIDGGGP